MGPKNDPLDPILRREIKAVDFIGSGVNVARDFAPRVIGRMARSAALLSRQARPSRSTSVSACQRVSVHPLLL